jgi:hypothetical protein
MLIRHACVDLHIGPHIDINIHAHVPIDIHRISFFTVTYNRSWTPKTFPSVSRMRVRVFTRPSQWPWNSRVAETVAATAPQQRQSLPIELFKERRKVRDDE